MNLNYRGDDTFKTFPGGILSLVMTIMVLCYFTMKTKQMILRESWKLVQQTVITNKQELTSPIF